MAKIKWIVLAFAFWTLPANAQPVNQYVGVGVYPFQAKGYCQLSVTGVTTLASCSSGIPTSSDIVEICVEGANGIRYRDDGTAPTTTIGMPINPVSATIASCFQYSGSSLAALQIISQSGTATVDASFYK